MNVKKYLNLKKLISQPFFVNVASLGLVQIANYIIPIIIIPFVVRALGVDFFGKTAYAQNIIAYLTLIVTYGFEYSATQDVAIWREDKSKLRTIFWTVIKTKTYLLTFSFILLAVLYFAFSKVNEDPVLYFYAALINVGMVMFPTWFFQGIEKMKNMAIFNFAIKALGAILIILLINSPTDYRTYLLILSASYIAVGIIAFFYVIRKYDLRMDKSDMDSTLSKDVVKKGFPIFLNNIFASLYTSAGLTILGFYCSNNDIGIYSGAYKIILAITMLVSMPINMALFPMMSKKFQQSVTDSWVFFKRSLFFIILLGIFVTVFIYFVAPTIVQLFLGNDFVKSIPLLTTFSVLPMLVLIASMFTVQGLYGFQLQKYSPWVGGITGTFCLIINLILIPKYGIYGAVYSYILSEIVEIMLSASFVLYKKT